ncbi:thioredoxin family protein [Desulfurococcus mucosus]|uniref:Glutaredoxin n=1 Tax=Desulfurococcus mucosus (strain ATCC 35584 / DSM 2162 / JCM 9187 / O7/1) TaxID=765177 RepID=E8R862_DESM0|nr:thioredoxin family protein [Desulfurococcus mucosus]ADV64688.1 glutaredoxin [Desulfurococcus mucosus DSM 2162]
MTGLFDPETEEELRKIFQSITRELNDVLVVSRDEESHVHGEDEDEHHHHHHHHGGCPTCGEAKMLAEEIVRISGGRVRFTVLDAKDAEALKPRYLPAFIYDTPKRNVRYYGLPSGQEFAPFIFIHDYISNGVKLSKSVVEELESIDAPLHVKIFVTPECPYCPLVVDFFNQAGLVNQGIVVETIEAFEHPVEADAYGVQYVPYVAITRLSDYDKYGAKPIEVIPGYLPPEENVKILRKAAGKLKRM